MTVAVVTDSASDLSEESGAGIAIVPLIVTFGDRSYRDREELDPDRFWSLLDQDPDFPTTSSPGPAAFAEAYREAASRGAEGVVSVHLSERLSRAVESARRAAGDAPIPVEVVDTRSVSLGQGLVARAAARAAETGTSVAEVAEVARAAADGATIVAVLDTVDHLRRGGRLGRARAALSELLRIRPVLTLQEGEPALVSRARTRGRAIEEMLRLAAGPAVEAAVLHGGAPEVDEVAAEIERSCGVPPLVEAIGAVTGSHLGPRALGVAVLRDPAG